MRIDQNHLPKCTHPRDSLLLTHGGDDGDVDVLACLEGLLDLLADVGLGDLDVVLGASVRVHEVKETVLDVEEEVLGTPDVGDVHVVGRGRDVLELLVGEDLRG